MIGCRGCCSCLQLFRVPLDFFFLKSMVPHPLPDMAGFAGSSSSEYISKDWLDIGGVSSTSFPFRWKKETFFLGFGLRSVFEFNFCFFIFVCYSLSVFYDGLREVCSLVFLAFFFFFFLFIFFFFFLFLF